MDTSYCTVLRNDSKYALAFEDQDATTAAIDIMIVIAHRGANREALENSFSAFDRAIDGGAERIELDTRLTKDGVAIVIHDDSLIASTGHDLRVSRLTTADLGEIPLKNGEAIPLLSEVLDRYLEKIEINIELKGNSLSLADTVGNLVKRRREKEKVIVSAFHWRPLARLADRFPSINRACLLGSDTFSWPFFANLAPQIFLDRCRANILHPSVGLVDENFMDQAKRRRWVVNPWIGMNGEEFDREGLWSALRTLEVDGVCTNYPRQLNQWLADCRLDDQYTSG